jgi:hypothetical protein
MPTATAKRERDPAAEIARYPVAHFIDCPAAEDAELAAEKVEHYQTRRITSKERPQDVQQQLPSEWVMVAHCCLCGGMSYHDLRSER